MPSRLTEEGNKQEADSTAASFALKHLDVPFTIQRLRTIVQHSTDLQPAGPCPCFDWLTGRSAISDREHIQLAETRNKDDMYKYLWAEGPMSSRRRKARQGSWDERLSITFGHKDATKACTPSGVFESAHSGVLNFVTVAWVTDAFLAHGPALSVCGTCQCALTPA